MDKDWFERKLAHKGHSLRALARAIDIDPSAASRMLNGQRKMKLPEAEKIARFLGATTEEVLAAAGVALSGSRRLSLNLTAQISDRGNVTALPAAIALPASVIARIQASISGDNPETVTIAQVKADKGPLHMWDDAVMVFEDTAVVQPAAVGVLSIMRLRDGVQTLATLNSARKTGEASITLPNGDTKEVSIVSAAPVLTVVP